jgi:hypothetical protein
MADATQRYDAYRHGPNAWMLGSFVVPSARLMEFERAARPFFSPAEPWPLAVVAGPDFGSDVEVISEFSKRAAPDAAVRAIEVKASTPDEVDAIARSAALLRSSVSAPLDTYVEVPITTDPTPMIQAIASHGLRAKVRTGGVTDDAFPAADRLAAFLIACREHGVSYKATAGLHHAMRGRYPLTYDPTSAHGTMFGFLNVFLAALFVGDGLDTRDARALLDERDASSLAFNAAGVTWRGRTVTAEAIGRARSLAATSFGSCSFEEPVAELAALGLLS